MESGFILRRNSYNGKAGSLWLKIGRWWGLGWWFCWKWRSNYSCEQRVKRACLQRGIWLKQNEKRFREVERSDFVWRWYRILVETIQQSPPIFCCWFTRMNNHRLIQQGYGCPFSFYNLVHISEAFFQFPVLRSSYLPESLQQCSKGCWLYFPKVNENIFPSWNLAVSNRWKSRLTTRYSSFRYSLNCLSVVVFPYCLTRFIVKYCPVSTMDLICLSLSEISTM